MMMKNNLLYLLTLSSLFLLTRCGDDDGGNSVVPPLKPRTGDFLLTIENVSPVKDYFMSGIFNTPVSADEPGAIADGARYEFSFHAGPSTLPGTMTKLSFALMLIKSNDLFLAPKPEGISLYDSAGKPITGDITDQVFLWDAGTEVNQAPGSGANQPMNGSGGMEEDGKVMLIKDGEADTSGFTYPHVADMFKVSLSSPSPAYFTVVLENVSGGSKLEGPFSPGVWVVHTGNGPLFEAGEADRGKGLEDIAESGDPAKLGQFLSENTGTVVPLSPGAWATYPKGKKPFFTAGAEDTKGIEGIAEDGNPAGLAASLDSDPDVGQHGIFNTPVGAGAPGPIGPGEKYEIPFTAEAGEYFNFASMYIQSNDLFYAFDDTGIALWNDAGNPISREVTDEVRLWDAGTEVNEFPGAGLNQAIRQQGADTGPDEGGSVELESDTFTYPPVTKVIKVTLRAK